MGAPQYTWLGLIGFILLVSAILHGKPKSAGKYDFFQAAFFLAGETALLWWGGFFG